MPALRWTCVVCLRAFTGNPDLYSGDHFPSAAWAAQNGYTVTKGRWLPVRQESPKETHTGRRRKTPQSGFLFPVHGGLPGGDSFTGFDEDDKEARQSEEDWQA